MKKLLILLSTGLFLLACGQQQKNDKVVNNFIQFKNFPKTVHLTKEKLPFDVLAPYAIYAVNNYLVLLSHHDSHMIQIYDTTDYANPVFGISKGNGHNEARFINFIRQINREPNNGSLWLVGTPNYLAELNLKESYSNRRIILNSKFDFLVDRRVPLLHSANAVYNIDQDNLLLLMDAERSGNKLNNANSFYVKYNYKENTFSDTTYTSDLRLLNGNDLLLSACDGAVRSDFKRGVEVHSFIDRINLINLEDKSIKVLYYEGFQPSKYPEKKDAKERYIGICVTDDLVWALGGDEKINDGNSYFFVFDWEGNLKFQVNLSEKIAYPDIDPESGYLYCINRTDEILRYNIKELLN